MTTKLINKLQRILFLIILGQFLFLPYTDASVRGKEHSYYIDARTPQGLQELFRYNGKSLPFVSSHRGGPEINMPENCVATFENTLKHTWSIMEIDPRYTKDSVMIVHHDPTLQRTTTGKGRVIDFTFDELKDLRLKDMKGNATHYPIPTFEEILKWGKGKTVFVLDDKGVSIQNRVKMVEKHNAESYCIVMAYSYNDAKICYRMNPNIMMQIFIATPEKFAEFEQTGIPWRNVVVFVGHKKPANMEVIKMIHDKGARCIMGTSRNLDREFIEGRVSRIEELKDGYNALLSERIDLLETDIPVPVSKVFNPERLVDPSIKKYFRKK
ncbi:MAG: glycerophosphodiester phosphodiesterase family protein [Prolixibacteraceae bacterium]|jgi:glycerophosphoryl diester phosphodiesterase|nr:glycerophosphodiester phosphodiesterase family protein [Prolixibacteraceae bacterium]